MIAHFRLLVLPPFPKEGWGGFKILNERVLG